MGDAYDVVCVGSVGVDIYPTQIIGNREEWPTEQEVRNLLGGEES
jgi:hypothetical protein